MPGGSPDAAARTPPISRRRPRPTEADGPGSAAAARAARHLPWGGDVRRGLVPPARAARAARRRPVPSAARPPYGVIVTSAEPVPSGPESAAGGPDDRMFGQARIVDPRHGRVPGRRGGEVRGRVALPSYAQRQRLQAAAQQERLVGRQDAARVDPYGHGTEGAAPPHDAPPVESVCPPKYLVADPRRAQGDGRSPGWRRSSRPRAAPRLTCDSSASAGRSARPSWGSRGSAPRGRARRPLPLDHATQSARRI